jgi:CubicO group peptidase (beta-lactamase class C family)
VPGVRHDAGLQTLVDALHGRGDLPALAVAVLDAGSDVVAWAGAGQATEPHLRFRIASVTKAAMALTAHRLAADGVLTLDEAIGGGATVTDLLSHTAGLPLELPGVDWLTQPPADASALGALLAEHAHPAGRSPFRYSNTGFWLLGDVLSRATGAGTEELVGETLGALSHVTGVGFTEPDLRGHLVTPRGRTVPSVARFAAPRHPSGGLTGDLASVAWLGRGLLAAVARFPALGEERAAIAEGWGWTAGLERWSTAGRVLLGHAGSWGGTRTQLALDPADGRVAVAAVTSHAGGPALRALLGAIGLPPASPERAAAVAPGPLPFGAFQDGPDQATLRPDPHDAGIVLLEEAAAGGVQRGRLLDAGLARLLDGPHAGEAVTTSPGGAVLRVGVRSLDRTAAA